MDHFVQRTASSLRPAMLRRPACSPRRSILRGIEMTLLYVGNKRSAFRQRVHVALGHGEAEASRWTPAIDAMLSNLRLLDGVENLRHRRDNLLISTPQQAARQYKNACARSISCARATSGCGFETHSS